MWDVLVYVYENYWAPDQCPAPAQLTRKLSAIGFESDEIEDALSWLEGLVERTGALNPIVTNDTPRAAVAPRPPLAPATTGAPPALRIYTADERERLGTEGLEFLGFLESAGVLSAHLREVVIDRVAAAGAGPLPLADLKIIVLMVFWSLGEEPDALILDELFVLPEERLIH